MEQAIGLKDLLDSALFAEYGIALRFPAPYLARNNRRRLYAVREKFRERGVQDYDGLSLIIKNGAELWIIRRDALPTGGGVEFLDCRSVVQDELPVRILSRGKSRVGVYIS